MDSDARWTAGEFETTEAALAKCREMIEEDLAHLHQLGMNAAELFARYKDFGDDPFIVSLGDAEPVEFSAWDYAERRSVQICEG
jgi:hypothetical protein